MKQITVENLTLGYNGRAVVENLSFSLSRGEYLCIVGENGSGKSTLIKALLKINKPLHGTITANDRHYYKNIGYLPQQSKAQRDFPASVEEVVLSGFVGRCGWRPFYTQKEKRIAEAHMKKLGITLLAKSSYRELSGGQQQRVLLARALCAAKDILLLDEPVAGLDPKITSEMYDLIENLNREDGVSVIMVSHDIEAATRYASHILHIHEGGHFFGTTEQYLKSDIHLQFATLEKGGKRQ